MEYLHGLFVAMGLFFALLGLSLIVIANHSWNILDLKERYLILLFAIGSLGLSFVFFYPIIFM